MNRQMVARELIVIARLLTATVFPSKGALKKYLQKHPGAKRKNHSVRYDEYDGSWGGPGSSRRTSPSYLPTRQDKPVSKPAPAPAKPATPPVPAKPVSLPPSTPSVPALDPATKSKSDAYWESRRPEPTSIADRIGLDRPALLYKKW